MVITVRATPLLIQLRRGLFLLRELIQEMFELGRITRETAKGMRADIVTLEAQLQGEEL